MTEQNVAPLELPATVVSYNRWTGFRSEEIGKLFECIPHDEVANLDPGALIWVDSEQQSGKVYGFDRAEVMAVRDVGRAIQVLFSGPNASGMTTVQKKDGWHKVHRCTDKRKLMELVQASPLATETGTMITMSDASFAYLTSIRAGVVSAD